MSRTVKNKKPCGYDFWSRRSRIGRSGKISKRLTKRSERAGDRKLERQAIIDPENVRGRIPGE